MTSKEIQKGLQQLSSLWESAQYKEAKILAFQLLDQADLQEDLESLSKVYNVLGIVYTNLYNLPEALKYFEHALRITREIDNRLAIGHCLGNIAVVYNLFGDFHESLKHYEQALSISEEMGFEASIASQFGNIGNVYRELTDHSKALVYYEKALAIDQKLNNKNGIAINMGNIGLVYQSLSDYPRALEFHNKALQIDQELDNKHGISRHNCNIGTVYNELSEYSLALEYFEKSLRIDEELGMKHGISINLICIGLAYFKLEDYPKALENMNAAFDLAIENGDKKGQMECTFHFSKIYEQMGDIEKAYSYFKQYIAVKDELHSEEAKQKAMLFDQKRILEEDEREHQLKLVRFKEQERIFHNILPVSIANRLIEGEKTIAESFENVSVFFSDIVGFTSLSSGMKPSELVQELNEIFSAFDRLASKYGLEKIKTIGDAYMAVCGLPDAFEDHQYRTSMFAIEALEVLHDLELGGYFKDLQIRIGIHCGSVVAGIIGEKKFAYDVWGDAVNIASRMESTSEGGRIHVSEAFAQIIQHHPEFSLIPREVINIKGKGMMNTFWLERGR